MAKCDRAVVIHHEAVGQAHPQRIIDNIADGGAVARSGKAVAETPILQRIGNRPLACFDIGQNLDGSCEPSTQTHAVLSMSGLVGRALPEVPVSVGVVTVIDAKSKA